MHRPELVVLTVTVLLFTGTALCFNSSPEFCVCGSNQTWNQDCKPLEDLLDSSTIPNNSVFSFCPGVHTLTQPCHITGVRNITLRAAMIGETFTAIRCESNNAGIHFSNVTGLTIRGIAVYNCGMHVNVQDNRTIKAAMVFEGGENITLQSVFASKSLVAAISLVDVAGHIVIEGSVFANATISEENKQYLFGNFIGYGKNNHSRTSKIIVKVKDTRFENNWFQNNSACNYKDQHLSAGLALILRHGNVDISLSNVTLSGNNGCAGGNVAIVLFDLGNLVGDTLISIGNGTNIEGGRGNVGGGISVTLVNSKDNPNSSQRTINDSLLLHIRDTTFSDNAADFVGGAIYLKHLETDHFSSVGIVKIENCTFEGNRLTGNVSGGMALHMTTFIVREYQFHQRPQMKVLVSVCNFTGHTSKFSGELGNAVIFVKTSPYFRISDSSVMNNNCTGLLAISSNVVVSKEVKISKNNALSGGGMLLCAGAVLYLGVDAHLLITGNHARLTGGGIHIERECIINRPRCFFQYSSSTLEKPSTKQPQVIVEDNTAESAGDNIYGGSVDNCYLINVSHADSRKSLDIFNRIFQGPRNNPFNMGNNSVIASPPRQVCQVNNGTRETNCVKIEKEIYPGETLHIDGVVVFGQLNGAVPGTVYLEVDHRQDHAVNIPKNYMVQTVPTKSPQRLSYRIYSKKENITAKLYLRVTQIVSDHIAPLELSVKIKQCPLGLTLSYNKSTQTTCSCNELRPYAHKKLKCYISQKVGIEYQPPVWIGMVQKQGSLSIAVSRTCPQDYCNDTEKIFLDLKTLKVNSTIQCYFNRIGVLCGGCEEGYSLLLGGSKCSQECSNYYLFLLLVFALAGIALVFFVTFLNLTVTEGTTNGLIFYANTIQIYAFFMFEKNKTYFAQFLKVFIAWLNLDFGIETCFFIGMDSFSKTLLQFAFPLYIWTIAGTIIWLSKYAVVAKLCGKNSIKVLATLILLSYSKILHAIVESLHFSPVHYLSQNGTVEYSLHWTTDGRLRYLEGKHAVVFFVGATFAVGALPCMLTLLCIQKIGLVSNWPSFCWVYRLKPFFDAFTGPFTDKGRFWVGFLLLTRIFIMALYSFNFNSSDTVVIATIVLTCFVLLLIAVLLPKGVYKKHSLNSLETFFIANLGCLFLGLFCSVYYDNETVKKYVVGISISLSFIVFVLILSRHVLVRMKCRHVLELYRFRQRQHREQHSYTESGSNHTMHQPPYSTFNNEEREPLLSTMD